MARFSARRSAIVPLLVSSLITAGCNSTDADPGATSTPAAATTIGMAGWVPLTRDSYSPGNDLNNQKLKGAPAPCVVTSTQEPAWKPVPANIYDKNGTFLSTGQAGIPYAYPPGYDACLSQFVILAVDVKAAQPFTLRIDGGEPARIFTADPSRWSKLDLTH